MGATSDTGFKLEDFSEAGINGRCGVTRRQRLQLVVRCIAQLGDRVLLCKRAHDPRCGFWSTPGGFLQAGETLHSAAARETLEETGSVIANTRLRFICGFPQLDQFVVTVLAEAESRSVDRDGESVDVRLFSRDAIPWRRLAFPTDRHALRLHGATASADRRERIHLIECAWDRDGRILATQIDDSAITPEKLSGLSAREAMALIRGGFQSKRF